MPKIKKSTTNKTIGVSTRIEKKVFEQLLTIANIDKRNVAQIIRFAISEFLERRKVAA